jgi:hypothetical protein
MMNTAQEESRPADLAALYQALAASAAALQAGEAGRARLHLSQLEQLCNDTWHALLAAEE